MMKPVLIFDYGHGTNTPGKCSPDGNFREWESNRVIGRMAAQAMRAHGYKVVETWTDDHEPGTDPNAVCTRKQINSALRWRVNAVNAICEKYGRANCLLVSFHTNAAGADGKWHEARGFSVFVSPNSSAASRLLASSIYDEAAKRGLDGNRCVPQQRYWVQKLAMCSQTHCPAVLIEALFMDNADDLAILKSEKGQRLIADSVTSGILKYINNNS